MKKIVIVLVCSMVLSGCVSGKVMENNLYQMRLVKGSKMIDGKTEAERSQDIKDKILMQMNELKAVAVVVESHTALIGLRVLPEFAEEGTRLKEEAKLIAMQTDAAISGTSVTTNERIISMIENLEHNA